MKSERWQQIKEILDATLDHSPLSRERFIRSACGVDAELASEVESYLEFERLENGFLEDEALNENFFALKQPSLVGKRFGKYELKKEIGRGGMGVVFLAERADGEFEQKVAVKLLQQGFFSAPARERFLREREILAQLRHPFIAHLIDGGTTDEGIPFLVMEYVEGLTITEYVNKNALSLEKRLELFVKICEAVSFAHRNLIVHRDLKPDNILITDGGKPKLLDFGIAKLLPEAEIEQTATHRRILTPEYASPEQITEGAVTTASDVFVLGIILYEILTGRRPFKFKNNENPVEIWETIAQRSVPRPSRLLKRESRNTNPANTSEDVENPAQEIARLISPSRLKGDLDNIVLKCLALDPERRYGSVEILAEDITRFERGLPVSAHADSFLYRARKFTRRNQLAVAASLLIFLILSAAVVFSLRQAHLAEAAQGKSERRLKDLRALTSSLMFELNDEIGISPTRARLELARKSSEYLNELAAEAGADPALRHELAEAYLKLGDLQGRPYQPNIGKTRAARESYRKSLELLKELYRENPSDEKVKRDLATAHERFGYLSGIRFFDWQTADEHLKKCIRLREELAALHPENSRYRARLADGYLYLGAVYPNFKKDQIPDSERLRTAFDLTQKSLKIRKDLLAAAPGSVQLKRDLAQAFQRLANAVTQYSSGKIEEEKLLEEKLSYHREALRLREEIAASQDAVSRDQRNLADELMMMSDTLVEAGENAEAEKILRRSEKIFYSLTLVDPLDAEAQYDYGNVLWRLGAALARQHKRTEAQEKLVAAKSVAQKIVALNPASLEYVELSVLINEDLKNL